MNKEEFFIEARKFHINEKTLNDHYKAFLLLIEKMPQITLQEYLGNAVKAQERVKHIKSGDFSVGSGWLEEFRKERENENWR